MTKDWSAVRRPDGSTYRSYLLRLWQEAPGDADRVLLQDVVSGATRGFPSLESLFAFWRTLRVPSEPTSPDGSNSVETDTGLSESQE
jgi:hypothetical protein